MENKLAKVITSSAKVSPYQLNILSVKLTHHRSFHSMANTFLNTNTPSSSTSPSTLSVDMQKVDVLRKALLQMREEKKKAELIFKENKKKAKEEETKAIQSLKPKRVPTPLLVYTSVQFNAVKEELMKSNKLPKDDSQTAMIMISQELTDRFSKLTPSEKNVYETFYQQEKKNYEKQMEIYRNAKKNRSALKGAPLSSYLRFYKDQLPNIKAELESKDQKTTANEMTKIASRKWKELDEVSKLKYKEEYAKDMAEYKARKVTTTLEEPLP